MKFGNFHELQIPRPWDNDTERKAVQNALEIAELCDKTGFDYIWAAEHHFLEEYAHNSAPEVFLAAASQRTKNIRIGHGIVHLPPLVNHPARVAERIGMLDLVSNGRAEFGSGAGASEAELGGFHVSQDEKKAMWREALDVVVRMFVEEPFTGHAGKYVDMPARNVVPKPCQKPHPPLWLACSRSETIQQAAQLGMGTLTFGFATPDAIRPWIQGYRETLENACVPAGHSVNTQFSMNVPFLCVRNDKEAERVAEEAFNFFSFGIAHYSESGEHIPGRTDVWARFKSGAKGLEMPDGWMSNFVNTPERIRARLREYEEAGLDQLVCLTQAGKISHEITCASLELFAREVMPEFKEREMKRARQRAESDARIQENALARKPKVQAPERPLAAIQPAGHH